MVCKQLCVECKNKDSQEKCYVLYGNRVFVKILIASITCPEQWCLKPKSTGFWLTVATYHQMQAKLMDKNDRQLIVEAYTHASHLQATVCYSAALAQSIHA